MNKQICIVSALEFRTNSNNSLKGIQSISSPMPSKMPYRESLQEKSFSWAPEQWK